MNFVLGKRDFSRPDCTKSLAVGGAAAFSCPVKAIPDFQAEPSIAAFVYSFRIGKLLPANQSKTKQWQSNDVLAANHVSANGLPSGCEAKCCPAQRAADFRSASGNLIFPRVARHGRRKVATDPGNCPWFKTELSRSFELPGSVHCQNEMRLVFLHRSVSLGAMCWCSWCNGLHVPL